MALVTDAGMPAVSDPGSEIVSAVAEMGFAVEVIPGPSAVSAALAVSGMSAEAFYFLGFLPRRRKERLEILANVSAIQDTLVIFEAPHRLRAALADLQQILGNRPIAVCRELTKLHEEAWRGDISGALQYFEAPRGEFVLVVEGADTSGRDAGDASPELARQLLMDLRETGARARDAVAQVVAATGMPRSQVYRLWLETGREGPE